MLASDPIMPLIGGITQFELKVANKYRQNRNKTFLQQAVLAVKSTKIKIQPVFCQPICAWPAKSI